MKLNLDASEQELENQIADEKKKDRYKHIFGILALLTVIGLICGYAYYSNQSQQNAEVLENQKMETLVSSGSKTGGDITKAFERVLKGSVVGYEAEYEFEVNGKYYKGKGILNSNPQNPLGGFNRIWITYDSNNPTNNATSYDVEIFRENPSGASEFSMSSWLDPKIVIRAIVVLAIGLFFRGGWWLWNRAADAIQGVRR